MALSVGAKRAIGAAVIVVCAAATGLGARKFVKPMEETSPAYRQKGSPTARVTIVEFSDFQCPACRVAEPPLRKTLELYGDDVRFIFKHLPLQIHPLALPAAVAAECAGRQERFWEFHDLLYDHQGDWSKPGGDKVIAAYAQRLKLDETAFTACRLDPSVAALIERDVQEARQRWVYSTPTFFINQKRFVGAKQLSERGSRWIEKQLKD